MIKNFIILKFYPLVTNIEFDSIFFMTGYTVHIVPGAPGTWHLRNSWGGSLGACTTSFALSARCVIAPYRLETASTSETTINLYVKRTMPNYSAKVKQKLSLNWNYNYLWIWNSCLFYENAIQVYGNNLKWIKMTVFWYAQV
jgi:hypothetical protein